MYLKKIKIGNVELENNILLAPMAGITDYAFRQICNKFNPGLTYSEMISAKGLFYNDKKTKLLIRKDVNQKLGIQIFGNEIEAIEKAIEYLNNIATVIDINMGCPAPKIIKNGDGSRLLKHLDKIEKIVETACKSSKVPITVKIRSGWDKDSIVAVDAARIIEHSGAKLITIHGRTKEQYYTGKVDLDIIKKVKESVTIPVIGNGDIISIEKAKEMFEYTNVDGIMLGRAAIGKPWIFSEIIEFFNNKNFLAFNNQEKLNIILEHINLAVEDKGENIAIKEMRKHICYYIKNLKNASKIRDKINTITSKKELVEILTKSYLEI